MWHACTQLKYYKLIRGPGLWCSASITHRWSLCKKRHAHYDLHPTTGKLTSKKEVCTNNWSLGDHLQKCTKWWSQKDLYMSKTEVPQLCTSCTLHAEPQFSALLDYVSRAHEIKICPLSIRPLSVHIAIISEPNAQISFKFHLWLLLATRRANLFI